MYKCMYVSEAGRMGGGEIGVGRGSRPLLPEPLENNFCLLEHFFHKSKKKGGMLPFVFHKATVPTISISIF